MHLERVGHNTSQLTDSLVGAVADAIAKAEGWRCGWSFGLVLPIGFRIMVQYFSLHAALPPPVGKPEVRCQRGCGDGIVVKTVAVVTVLVVKWF